MLTTLRHSNAQDEDDPTYVEILRQRTYYENLLILAHFHIVIPLAALFTKPPLRPQLNLNPQKEKMKTQKNCLITPRCLKWEAHQTRDCVIQKPVQILNQLGEAYYMANYSGCPQIPKPRS
ncbi:hypothetical protein TNIN_429861 [Trichonephila inaurata madagascariensis]|uniref:Uncharacterized protein n=1 Tax=Trichonephila inaurata madagascariensis TaxID=2747483 RepID=A0A8X6XF62_9ARAC|nr:hypothetical protein TNIN_429861 [Trichonephila inaurata madagascariensis]